MLDCFPKRPHHFIIPLALHKCPNFSTSSPTLVTLFLFFTLVILCVQYLIVVLCSFSIWLHPLACGILSPWPGIEPVLPAVEEWSLNHWTALHCGFDLQLPKDNEKALAWRRQWLPTPAFLPRNPMDRGAWWATVHGGHRESGTTERLSMYTRFIQIFFRMFFKSAKPFKVFTSCIGFPGCCNKLPQTRWPDISEMYSLLVVVARCPQSRATLPPEALQETLPSPLPALGGCWHSLGYGHISLSALSSHCLLLCVISLCLSLIRTLLL